LLLNYQHNGTNMKQQELGNLIRQRRKVVGLTIRGLAELTDMSKTTISQIERGNANPTYEALLKIFEYLNLEFRVEVKMQGR